MGSYKYCPNGHGMKEPSISELRHGQKCEKCDYEEEFGVGEQINYMLERWAEASEIMKAEGETDAQVLERMSKNLMKFPIDCCGCTPDNVVISCAKHGYSHWNEHIGLTEGVIDMDIKEIEELVSTYIADTNGDGLAKKIARAVTEYIGKPKRFCEKCTGIGQHDSGCADFRPEPFGSTEKGRKFFDAQKKILEDSEFLKSRGWNFAVNEQYESDGSYKWVHPTIKERVLTRDQALRYERGELVKKARRKKEPLKEVKRWEEELAEVSHYHKKADYLIVRGWTLERDYETGRSSWINPRDNITYMMDTALQIEGFGEHDAVNHPSHYTSHPSGVECITVTEHMNFNVGNAVKYLWRADMKNGDEDLKKAAWYVAREIERREKFRDGGL